MLLLVLLAVLTIAAWRLTVFQAATMSMPMSEVASDTTSSMMAGHASSPPPVMPAAGPGWAAFVAFLVAWAVMMAAMMFPAASPTLLLVHRVSNQHRTPGNGFSRTWTFAAGYLLVWIVTGVPVWAILQLGGDLTTGLSSVDRATWAPRVLGATLILAGLYQLSPLKRVCLDRCRAPLDFLITSWRAGYRGALQMGVRHGAICLGCCWALFAVLVAAGTMSLAWMLLITVVVFAEKTLPFGRQAAAAVGVGFVVTGVVIALT